MRLIWTVIYLLPIIALTTILVTAEKQATASIRGQVYADRLGLLFSNAKVEIYSDNRLVDSVVSDDLGRYTIRNLNPGRYTVVGNLPATRLKRAVIELQAGEQMLLNIGLQVGALGGTPPTTSFISGTVRNLDKTAVKDAVITVLSPLDQQIIAKGISDGQGRYNLRVDYGAQFIVVASKPG